MTQCSWLETKLTSPISPIYSQEESEIRGLDINRKKAKLMVFCKNKISSNKRITLNNEETTSGWKLALAKKFFTDTSSIFTNEQLDINTQQNDEVLYLVHPNVWSIDLSKQIWEAARSHGNVDFPSHEEKFMDRWENKQRGSGNYGRWTEIAKNYSLETTGILRAHRKRSVDLKAGSKKAEWRSIGAEEDKIFFRVWRWG